MEKEKESSAPVFGLNNPFNDLCGLEIAEQRSGHCTVVCRAGERHLNHNGTVHGGLLFTMMVCRPRGRFRRRYPLRDAERLARFSPPGSAWGPDR